MSEFPPSYPRKLGIVAFKDGSFEVDIGAPVTSPNVVFYREDVVKYLTNQLALIKVQSEFFTQQSFSADVLNNTLRQINIIATTAIEITKPPIGREGK